MGTMARLCATAAAITLVCGLASPPAFAETKLPTEVFHDIIEKFASAEDQGDAEALAKLFTDDAILVPAGVEQPIQGQENIRRFLKDYIKYKMENHKITPTALMLAGPKTMIDAGITSGDVLGQDGALTHVTGTYLAVGILVDQQWKLWAVSWNRDFPTDAFSSLMPPQAGSSTPNK